VSACDNASEFGVTALCLLGDGHTAVVGDKGGGVRAWDCRTWRSTQTFSGPMGSVRCVLSKRRAQRTDSFKLCACMRPKWAP
jgi:hypothetical protein